MIVLVADDDPQNRYLMRMLFERSGHVVLESENGVQALETARCTHPDVIVADILMPIMDGYALCREWKSDTTLMSVPFAFYSANYTESDDKRFALSLGADLFLTKPMDPVELLGQIESLVADIRTSDTVTRTPDSTDESHVLREHNARLIHKLEQQLSELSAANVRLRDMLVSTVRAIAMLMEARDPYTAGHQERVASLAHAISMELDMSEDDAEGVRVAGLIHDIGKISIPSGILTMPRRLTLEEFALVKTHPDVAFRVLNGIDFPWPVAQYVVQHHERLDGSGYPTGCGQNDILLGSRVLAVADVVEAMTTHRPYRAALGLDSALSEVSAGAGTRYDADVVDACRGVFESGRFAFEVQPVPDY